MNHWLTYSVQERLASRVTNSANWDADTGSDGAIAIPEGTYFVVVYLDHPAYLFADKSAAAPTVDVDDGAIYAAELTHIVPCRGCTHLHYRQTTSSVTIRATAFKAS